MNNKIIYEEIIKLKSNFNLKLYNFMFVNEAIFGDMELNVFYEMEHIIGLRHYY
jgi:hypothetical protein